MKFTIIFMGLISQLALNDNQRLAVAIKSPSPPHRAWVRVAQSDLVANPVFAKSLRRIKNDCPAGDACFSWEGEHLTLNGVPEGATSLESSFMTHVPHLSQITAPSTNMTVVINPNVIARKTHQDVSGDLAFSGGSLSVKRVWCPQVEFDDHGDSVLDPPGPACVAHDVVYTSGEIASTKKFVELTSDTSRKIRVRPGATVHFENLPHPRITTHVAHFHHHRLILDNARVMAEMVPTSAPTPKPCAPVDSTGESCIPGIPVPAAHSRGSNGDLHPTGVDYECSGSQWP
jgi:hypothetical protein